MSTPPPPAASLRRFERKRPDIVPGPFTRLTGLAAFRLLAILAAILGNILYHGLPGLSWRFVSTIPRKDMFEPESAAVLSMNVVPSNRVRVIAIFVPPVR